MTSDETTKINNKIVFIKEESDETESNFGKSNFIKNMVEFANSCKPLEAKYAQLINENFERLI